jgi:hypothetical protein
MGWGGTQINKMWSQLSRNPDITREKTHSIFIQQELTLRWFGSYKSGFESQLYHVSFVWPAEGGDINTS